MDLAEKARGLESRVAELESERCDLQEEVEALRGVRAVLEAVVAVERELSATVSRATWEAMECMEGAMTELGVVCLWGPRRHTVNQMDAALDRLHRAREVFLPVARAYGNHYAKAAWTTALVSLQRAGCGHVDTLGARSVPVASTIEIASGQKQVRRASNILAQDFWVP